MRNIIIAGAGIGENLRLTQEVINAIENSEYIIAARVHEKIIPADKKIIWLDDFERAFKILDNISSALILVSGDPCIYSLMPLVKKRFPDAEIKILSGVSSLQIICAYACETWNDAKIFSCHGRELNTGYFLNMIEREHKIILFCDKQNTPSCICEKLKEMRLKIFIGENLGMADEKFYVGTPDDFINKKFGSYSIMLILNNNPFELKNFPGDNDFERALNIPITNEIIRQVVLSRLDLKNNSVIWDIGAGTGSISISAALKNLSCKIHAIEYKSEALKIIEANIKKFHLHNINIIQGHALDVINNLPEPDNIFIGGSEGELTGIFERVKYFIEAGKNLRLVMTCVTPENFNTAYDFMKRLKNFECVQIQANKLKSAGGKFFMNACNPVIVLSSNTL